MTRFSGLLLTLLQATLVSSLPHHHNGFLAVDLILDESFPGFGTVSAEIVESFVAFTSTPSSSDAESATPGVTSSAAPSIVAAATVASSPAPPLEGENTIGGPNVFLPTSTTELFTSIPASPTISPSQSSMLQVIESTVSTTVSVFSPAMVAATSTQISATPSSMLLESSSSIVLVVSASSSTVTPATPSSSLLQSSAVVASVVSKSSGTLTSATTSSSSSEGSSSASSVVTEVSSALTSATSSTPSVESSSSTLVTSQLPASTPVDTSSASTLLPSSETTATFTTRIQKSAVPSMRSFSLSSVTSIDSTSASTSTALVNIPSSTSTQPVQSKTAKVSHKGSSSNVAISSADSTTPIASSFPTVPLWTDAPPVESTTSTEDRSVAASEVPSTQASVSVTKADSITSISTAASIGSEPSPDGEDLEPVVRTTTITIDLTQTITSCWTSYHAAPKSSSKPAITVGRSVSSSVTPDAVSVESRASTTSNSASKVSAVITQGSTENPVTVTVSLVTTLTTSELQTVTVTASPLTSQTLHTSLATAGNPSTQPFNTTVIPTPGSKISPVTTGSAVIHTSSIVTSSMPAGNIFSAVNAGGPPPAQISTRGDHPVPTLGINKTGPIETNKFYANFFLGTRNAPAFTFPYSVSWIGGQGVSGSWGVGISQVTGAQRVYGSGSPASYYINPGGLESVIISARQLGALTSLTMSELAGFSARVNLAPSAGAAPMLSFPLVQGMSMVTGVYTNGTPLVQSTIFFSALRYGGVVSGGSTVRYIVTLLDKTTWFIYMTADSGSKLPTLTLASDQQIIGNMAFSGTVQVAKSPALVSQATAEALYDETAGVYPVAGAITGSVSGAHGSYTLSWTKAGLTSKRLLMWALPHHIASISPITAGAVQRSFLMQTTTKGLATAIFADSWTMNEELPVTMGFAPWSPALGAVTVLPASAKALINEVAATELNEDIESQTDLNSMYFAGKGLAKFASIVYAANNLGGATGVASAGLIKLKAQFARFVNNTQIYPLVYDSVWGGVVSSASYLTGDDGIDFGNTYYNDHHFHYGYFVYTAAVIGYLDPAWLTQGTNKAWVNTLVRDYANPVQTDGYLPFSRMFDYFHGHSWAAGLFESYDGKNQESSSEDTFASYALKMWGRTIGDTNMEARGNLMLAVQARSLNSYYLMQSSNTIQPSEFIGNKAAGILFENKVDHTTYFGTNIEYIEGIHMLPLNPSSSLTRNANFVTQEWNTYFSNGRVDSIAGGWRGILYANLAIIDPKTAYAWFADPNFNNAYLDGGASRTWYLALSAGLGGAS